MGIEKGTELGYAREIAVANNLGIRVGLLQFFEQEPEGCLLPGSASVSIATFIIHAANVANTDGVLIVVLDMGTCEFLGTAGMNAAILIDYPVVAAAVPALGLVPAVNVFDSDLLADLGIGAVNNNPLHILHWFHHVL